MTIPRDVPVRPASPPLSRLALGAVALVALAGCGGGSAPVTIQSITVVSGSGQTGSVGSALAAPLLVRVTGSDARGYAGATVTFQVTSGGGSLNPASVNTGPDGSAQTTFTLDTTVGPHVVTATAGTVSATFQATAQAGAPAAVEAVAGTGQTARPGQRLAQAIVVRVRDQYQNPVPSASVTFQVSAAGQVSPAQANTDAQGQAQTAWTLGSSVGQQTLTARAGNATATVTAQSFDPCLVATAYTIGSTLTGQLTTADCTLTVLNRAVFVDFLSFSLSQAGAVELIQDSSDAWLLLFRGGATVALHPEIGGQTTQRAQFRAVVRSGDYTVAATSFNPGVVGSYTLRSSTPLSFFTNCENWWSAVGLQISAQAASTDCRFTAGAVSYFGDIVKVYLAAGQRLRVTMTSTTIDSYIQILNAAGVTVGSDNNSAGGLNATLQITAAEAGAFEVWLIAFVNQQTGSYTVQFQDPAATLLAEEARVLGPVAPLSGLAYRFLPPGERPRFPSAVLPAPASEHERTGPLRRSTPPDGLR